METRGALTPTELVVGERSTEVGAAARAPQPRRLATSRFDHWLTEPKGAGAGAVVQEPFPDRTLT